MSSIVCYKGVVGLQGPLGPPGPPGISVSSISHWSNMYFSTSFHHECCSSLNIPTGRSRTERFQGINCKLCFHPSHCFAAIRCPLCVLWEWVSSWLCPWYLVSCQGSAGQKGDTGLIGPPGPPVSYLFIIITFREINQNTHYTLRML